MCNGLEFETRSGSPSTSMLSLTDVVCHVTEPRSLSFAGPSCLRMVDGRSFAGKPGFVVGTISIITSRNNLYFQVGMAVGFFPAVGAWHMVLGVLSLMLNSFALIGMFKQEKMIEPWCLGFDGSLAGGWWLVVGRYGGAFHES